MARSVVTFDRATERHARELAPRMRPADAAEVLASGGYAPLEALLAAIEVSTEAYAAYIDGDLACLLGVARGSFVSGTAYPWLLTSDVVDRRRAAFLRWSRAVLEDWVERYGQLEQQVDARHAQALRWAARIGFTVHPPAPFGVAGLPFCRITLRRYEHV